MTKKTAFTFYNHPKELLKSDYTNALENISQRFMASAGTSAIYTWGKVSVPGISDLDMCIILDNKNPSVPFMLRSFRFLGSTEKYIFVHPFVFISRKDLEQIEFVYPSHNLEHHTGDGTKIESLGKKEKDAANICLLNDLIIRHFPRDYMKMVFTRSIDARIALLRLNSLCATIRVCKDLGKKLGLAERNFLEEVKALRQDWFDRESYPPKDPMKRDFKLGKLVESGLEISLDVVEFFDRYAEKNELIAINNIERDFTFKDSKNYCMFLKDWSPRKAVILMRKEFMLTGRLMACLPARLGVQLIEYSEAQGPISEHIKERLRGLALSYTFKNYEVARKRVSIFNSQAELAERSKHGHFPAFFDFGHRAKNGIVNSLQNAYYLWKMRKDLSLA